LRIVLVAPYPPARDGIGNYTQLIRNELVAQGHEAVVVSARSISGPLPETIGSIPSKSPERDELLAAIRKFRPDVVHVQFAVAAYGLRTKDLLKFLAILKASRYPVVLTLHEVTRDTQSLHAVGRWIYRKVCANADLTILHTASAKSHLDSFLQSDESRLRVIPHPQAVLPPSDVTEDELRAAFDLSDCRVVLAFGFLELNKGVHDLIRAAKMARHTSDVMFVIAGSARRRFGPFRIFELRDRVYERVLHKIASGAGTGGRIVFTGYVPDGSIAGWFEVADLVVLPYRRSEQSGVANIALAAGATLLTSSAGELPSLSTLPAVAPGKPRELAAALEAFFAKAVPREARTLPTPDITAVVERTVEAYQSALKFS
jgi:glycosyltransferase involved in cell wall biosynthesis